MSDSLLDRLELAARCARLCWTAAHVAGALEAGTTPDRYVAYVVVAELLTVLNAAVLEEP